MAAQGNLIILTPDRGYWVEGIVKTGQTFYPGMLVQSDPTVATQGNRLVHKLYDRSADGDFPAGPHVVVCEDLRQGKTVDDAYSAGERFFGFVPLPGCELNLLFTTPAGTGTATGADVAKGDLLIADDGTGKVIVTTGSPDQEIAMALSAADDVIDDELVHAIWSGN